MTVTFFRQLASGPEQIGTISLKEGRLIADPAEAPALQYVLAEPLHVYQYQGSQPPIFIDPVRQPEEFLAALPKVYHGTYFWAEAVA